MTSFFYKSFFVFVCLLVGTSFLMDQSQIEFGTINFFDQHGIFFLIFITFFPRLTLLFSSVPTGGVMWWLGFFFAPRLLVATLATLAYFHTNPVLVVMSWMVAFGGEYAEKRGIKNRSFVFKTMKFPQEKTAQKFDDKGTIEAEFTTKP